MKYQEYKTGIANRRAERNGKERTRETGVERNRMGQKNRIELQS